MAQNVSSAKKPDIGHHWERYQEQGSQHIEPWRIRSLHIICNLLFASEGHNRVREGTE